MTEKPVFGATDTVPPVDTTRLGKITLRELADMSGGFPQIGHRDPADDVRRSVISAGSGRATREEIPVQPPETAQSQSDPLAEYPWGIFSLIREIADGKPGSLTGDNQVPVIDPESER